MVVRDAVEDAGFWFRACGVLHHGRDPRKGVTPEPPAMQIKCLFGSNTGKKRPVGGMTQSFWPALTQSTEARAHFGRRV